MSKIILHLLSIPCLLLGACSPSPPSAIPAPSNTVNPARSNTTTPIAELQGLDIDRFFEESFRLLMLRDPDTLIMEGIADDYGLEDTGHFTNNSDTYVRETQQLEKNILEILHSYNRQALSEEQQRSYDIYEWLLEDRIAGHEFMYYGYPISSMELFSEDFVVIDFLSRLYPIQNRQDAEDYVSHLSEFDTWVEQMLERLEHGQQAGVIPPKFMLERSIEQMNDYMGLVSAGHYDAENHPLYTSFVENLEPLDDLSAEEKQELVERAKSEIENTVGPAFKELQNYLITLRPLAAELPDLGRLPQGGAYYEYLLKHETTTTMSAAEVHALGLQEVERIRAEIMDVAYNELGYDEDISMLDLYGSLAEETGGYDEHTLLTVFQTELEEVERVSAEYMDMPAAEVQIEIDPDGVVNYYIGPSIDGSRPGVYYVTPGGMWAYLAAPTLYHETIPGHHLQIATALELDLPTFQKASQINAYVEGWALYAERLAWEMGIYENDPAGNLGRLNMELLRAARLVVDTGLNAEGWSFNQAATYMSETVGNRVPPEAMVRFTAAPGQGCSYYIGYMQIMQMRHDAMQRLGERFDIREFNNLILSGGPMPMEILEARVNAWVEDQE